MLRDADDLHAPVLRFTALVTQTLERDPHFHFKTPRRHSAVRLVNVVRIQVDNAVEAAAGIGTAGGARDPLAAHAVLLHAQRIDLEQRGATPVVERVEQDLDVVVGADVVAVGERGPHDAAVRLIRANAEVDRVGCVEDEDLRRILRRPAVDGAVLAESGEQRRLAPDVLVEHPVDAHRRRLDAGGAHVELTEVAVVN